MGWLSENYVLTMKNKSYSVTAEIDVPASGAQGVIIAPDETCNVGQDTGSPVSPDYGPTGNAFSGKVHWVRIDLEGDDQNHLITPEQRLGVAMARQ